MPPEPWDGVRDARRVRRDREAREGRREDAHPRARDPGDATLNVNVFTPAPGDAAAALPVLVYIHGGAFIEGSPASPWYDGAGFNRDGVVTVTISYRLGFDGFGHIAGAPSNRGVRDWLAALEWVRENIAAFGGDPARVTIAGQSAGGGAVVTLLGMPAAQGLFHAVWALSPALADVPAEVARTLSAKVANLAGVAPTRAGFASVSEAELFALQEAAAKPDSKGPLAVIHALLEVGLIWGPMIDGDLIAQPTLDSLRAGVGSRIPLVLGANDDEFTMVTDSVKNKLRLVPASLALGQLKVDAATRKAYLAANSAQRRKGTAAVLGRFAGDFAVPVGCRADRRGTGGRPHLGLSLRLAVARDRLGVPLPRRAVLVRLPGRGGCRRDRWRRPAPQARERAARVGRVIRPRRRARLAGVVCGIRHDAGVRRRPVAPRCLRRRLRERARAGLSGSPLSAQRRARPRRSRGCRASRCGCRRPRS